MLLYIEEVCSCHWGACAKEHLFTYSYLWSFSRGPCLPVVLLCRFSVKSSTATGILFVLCGCACGLCKLLAAGLVLCGFGNAFYHVKCRHRPHRKKGLRDSGIFVSAWTLGVSLGTYLASCHVLSEGSLSLTTILILLLLIVFLLLQTQVISSIKQTTGSHSAKTNTALLLLSLFAVFIRSLGGLFFPSSSGCCFPFPRTTSW